jgi:hypothetical protein
VRRLLLMVEGTGDPTLTLDTVAAVGACVAPRIRAETVAH